MNMKASLLMLFCCLTASAAISTPRPNILFILADDMGYSDMGWQGSAIHTPNLDKLRAGGIFLERCYAQPQCSPSRVAFLSGRYPYHYGLQEHIVLPWSLTGLPGRVSATPPSGQPDDDGPRAGLPDGRATIAEKLKAGGYETAVVGKWHVGSHLQSYLPQNHGFDYSFVCMDGDMSYWNYTHAGRNDIICNGKKFYAKSMQDSEASGNTYATDLWAQKAVEVISQHDTRGPLFLYLAFNAPHWPLQAPKKLLEKYPLNNIPDYWAGPHADLGRTAAHRRAYMAMVDALDSAIGEVIRALKEKSILENTLIVFSSDNGGIPDADNRPLRSIKGDSFEGGVRVPCIAWWPGRIKPGSSSAQLVYIADWYPTFAGIAGLRVKGEGLDGVSALSILEGGKGSRPEVPIISEGRHALIAQQYSLVGGGNYYYQLIHQKLSGFQLYDLEADVSQQEPTSQSPETAEEMRLKLSAHFRKTNRGYFNWDIRYSRYRQDERPGDHNYDNVVNDLPKLTVAKTGSQTTVTISPVSHELVYRLEDTMDDGTHWGYRGEYFCKADEGAYTFPAFATPKGVRQYRVETAPRFGLPARDTFLLAPGKYHLGPLDTEGKPVEGKKLLPPIEGFLPICDLAGAQNVRIVNESLAYPGWPRDGGALQIDSEGSLTRYFMEPHNRGKVYASLLVQHTGAGTAEINWLRQINLNQRVQPVFDNNQIGQPVSLSLTSDGIYLDQTDGVSETPKARLGGYDGRVACVVFAFDLGPTGCDSLRVYLNPTAINARTAPAATLQGEFTFDRLQFRLSGGPGSRMKADEIRVGSRLQDVLPSAGTW